MIVEPDRWADQDIAQRHAAAARTGGVLGEVGVDEACAHPGRVTTRSTTYTAPYHARAATRLRLAACGRDNSRHPRAGPLRRSNMGIVMNPWMPPSNVCTHRRHSGRLESIAVCNTLVPQRIVSRDHDDRRR